MNDEENSLGVRSLAAPVFDHSDVATAAISIAGPAFRLSSEQLDELVDPLIDAANKLSALLGFAANGRTASHSSGRS